MYLPDIKEGKKKPTAPIWLGVPGEVHFHSILELPKNYTPELPKKIDLKEDFAEYHAEYLVTNGALVTDRRLAFVTAEIPVSEYEKYAAFRKQVNDDRDLLISLSTPSNRKDNSSEEGANAVDNSMEEMRRAVWAVPASSDAVAAQYEKDARDAMLRNDFNAATESLRAAVNKDPKFARAWLWLGSMLASRFQQDAAVEAYQNAVSADPSRAISYKLLGFSLMSANKYEEAVSAWQSLIKIAPEDHDGEANLGNALKALKRYSEAASALEAAIKLMPDKVSLQLGLADAYLGAGDAEKARTAFQQAIKLDPSPVVLNDIAYELAEKNIDLNVAKTYSERAVSAEEEASGKLQISALKSSDLDQTQRLATFWDTLGWIYFRLNDLAGAEKYLTSAWQLSQSTIVGLHLGRVYERQGKKAAALNIYQLARSAVPFRITRPGSFTPRRDDSRLDANIKRLGGKQDSRFAGDLSQMRTYKLPKIISGTGSAEFLVLLGPGKKVESKFVSGDDALKSANKNISTVKFSFALPNDTARVAWSGLLGCYPHSGCAIVMMISNPSFQFR